MTDCQRQEVTVHASCFRPSKVFSLNLIQNHFHSDSFLSNFLYTATSWRDTRIYDRNRKDRSKAVWVGKESLPSIIDFSPVLLSEVHWLGLLFNLYFAFRHVLKTTTGTIPVTLLLSRTRNEISFLGLKGVRCFIE